MATTTPVLTLDKQMQIRPISYNWGKFSVDGTGILTNFKLALQDVEAMHLKNMLGRDLLLDIKTNPSNYEEVLTGGTYEIDCGGTTRNIPFEGLKYITAYFIASLYVNRSYKQDSYSGMIRKNQEEAAGLSAAERREERLNLESIALEEWKQLRIYLDKNKDTYELWEQFKRPSNTVKPLIMSVRKTYLK